MEKPKARSRKIIFRLSDEQYEEIAKAVEKHGYHSISEYVRERTLDPEMPVKVAPGSRIASAEGE